VAFAMQPNMTYIAGDIKPPRLVYIIHVIFPSLFTLSFIFFIVYIHSMYVNMYKMYVNMVEKRQVCK